MVVRGRLGKSREDGTSRSETVKLWSTETTWCFDLPAWYEQLCGPVPLGFALAVGGYFHLYPEPPKTLGRICTHPWYCRNA